MDAKQIPIVVVSYNSPELLRNLLDSLRRFYPNPVHVVDGSEAAPLEAIRAVAAQYPGVTLHAQGYNIHHGPGMAWALQQLPLGPQVLFLDSDIVVLRAGFIEAMLEHLEPHLYGVGGVAYVDREGFDVPYAYGAVPYLHPPCMLCNVEVMRQWPMPIKHGAPMISAMLALHDAGQSDLLRDIDWTRNDVTPGTRKVYIDHVGRGTVSNTQGYHLEEWMAEVRAKKAAPAEPPTGFNPDVLRLIPAQAKAIVEVGCSTGALAHALRQERPGVHFVGLELDPRAAEVAGHFCDRVEQADIEAMDDAAFARLADRDCWIFGDVLEHLRDPWRVLRRVARVLPPGGCVVASIPNAQHWSIQARLAIGEFRYEPAGLMDRSHLRWFTRVTLFELFKSAGLKVEAGVPCVFQEPPRRELVLAAIKQMALAMGRDPDAAAQDAEALQYVVRAVAA